jgi:hypothetical protein
VSKAGLPASDNNSDSDVISKCQSRELDDTTSVDVSPKITTSKKPAVNSTDYLSQSSLPPSDTSPFANKKENKNNFIAAPKLTFEALQANNFIEKAMKEKNEDDIVEVLATVQYYSSPDKLCKTVAGDALVVNGAVRDDPTKKYFHPVQKEKEKDRSKTKAKHSKHESSRTVADIMRIGLSNKEIEERENLLIRQKKKLGIPKAGYIEGIRSKNNANLFKIQKQSIEHRQNLNRRANEFRVAKAEYTKKGIDAATRRELMRPAQRESRLCDMTVEDSIWQSKVSPNQELSAIFGEQSSILNNLNNHRLNDVSQMSDFKHIVKPLIPRKSRRDSGQMRKDIATEKEKFQILLKQKVLEKASEDIKSTVFVCSMQPSAHSDITPREGESRFLANQSRMEEVFESKEIQFLEKQKWIVSVIDLVKGLATKRKKMTMKEKEKSPITPDVVFTYIACILRIILAGVTIDKEAFKAVTQKVFSQNDHHDIVVNQIVTMVRTHLNIQPQEYCDFLLSIGVQVNIHTTIYIF